MHTRLSAALRCSGQRSKVKGHRSYQVSLHLLPQSGELPEAELPVPAVLLVVKMTCRLSFVYRNRRSSYYYDDDNNDDNNNNNNNNNNNKPEQDTSIRFTMTLQVSRLKPSVLMSVPVKK
ncbi:hypothetical protein EYF80_064823 [Liparis tanakae]|uniref:Uncharacterized protein n=1 Tax=Liparis tanakae TaxID=230148 RepID=A0A4Z2E8C7_9TELE|nr:hypothetical protein EYF80_064823 [Liparis tanakae]